MTTPSRAKTTTSPKPEMEPHGHPHEHDLKDHEHPHSHELEKHEHPTNSDVVESIGEISRYVLVHSHDNITSMVRNLVRAIEAGSYNSDQSRILHDIKVALGDAKGLFCKHENASNNDEDKLICPDCGSVVE